MNWNYLSEAKYLFLENRRFIGWVFVGFVVTLSFRFLSIEPKKSKILIPESIMNLVALQDTTVRLKKNFETNKEFIIVSAFDATCIQCLDELARWKLILASLDDSRFETVFVTYNTRAEILRYHTDQLTEPFPYLIYCDYQNAFLEANGLTQYSSIKTFVINKRFDVVISGSPTHSPELRKTYAEVLGMKNS